MNFPMMLFFGSLHREGFAIFSLANVPLFSNLVILLEG